LFNPRGRTGVGVFRFPHIRRLPPACCADPPVWCGAGLSKVGKLRSSGPRSGGPRGKTARLPAAPRARRGVPQVPA